MNFSKAFIILFIVLFIALVVQTVAGEGSDLRVVIVQENRAFNPGEMINISVYIYAGSVRIQPDEADGKLIAGDTTTDLEMTEVATGHFTAVIELSTDILSQRIQEVHISAQYGNESTSGIFVLDIHDFHVTITIDNPLPQAGDTIEIFARSFDGTVRFDPDHIQIWADIDQDGTVYGSKHIRQELVLGKLTTGVYRSTFTINSDVNTSHTYRFSAEVSVGNLSYSSSAEATLRFYHVFSRIMGIRNESSTSREGATEGKVKDGLSVQYDLYVLDHENARVGEAFVWLHYIIFSDHIPVMEGTKIGITDSQGKLSDSFSCVDFDSVLISGWVNKSFDQMFQGALHVDDDEAGSSSGLFPPRAPPGLGGFQVSPCTDQIAISAGEAFTRFYYAYLDGEPIPEGKVHVFAFTRDNVFLDTMLTITQGVMSVTFDPIYLPEGRSNTLLTMDFRYNGTSTPQVQTLRIPVTRNNILPIIDVTIEIEEFVIGGLTDIIVDDPNLTRYQGFVLSFPIPESVGDYDIPWILRILLAEVPGTFPLNVTRGWDEWTVGIPYLNGYSLLEHELGFFSTGFFTPDLWDPEGRYLIIAVFIDSIIYEMLPLNFHFGAVILEDGGGTTHDKDSDGLNFLSGTDFQGIMVSIIVSLIMISQRNRALTSR